MKLFEAFKQYKTEHDMNAGWLELTSIFFAV